MPDGIFIIRSKAELAFATVAGAIHAQPKETLLAADKILGDTLINHVDYTTNGAAAIKQGGRATEDFNLFGG